MLDCGDSTEQEVCQVTFNVANMPDPLVYWRREDYLLSGTPYNYWRKITLTGFSQLNGSYITTRGNDCVWQNTTGSYSCTYEAISYPGDDALSCPDVPYPSSTESGSCNLIYEFALDLSFNQFHDVKLDADIPTLVSTASVATNFPDLRPVSPVSSNYFPCGTTNLQLVVGIPSDGNGASCPGTGSRQTYTGSNAVSSS